jgi:hydroxymethylpyrimidine/phosphomethylpyrimidine kinase
MNNTARLIVGILFAGALAALATPELAAKMPHGISTALAAAIAAMLHRMDAKQSCDTSSSSS